MVNRSLAVLLIGSVVIIMAVLFASGLILHFPSIAVSQHSASRSIQVVQAATSLTADFTYPIPVTSGSPVTFNATVAGGSSPYGVSWATGNGQTLHGNLVTFTYPSAGTFNVILTVVDALGTTATASHSVTVQDSGGLNPDFTFPMITQNSPVTFSGGIVRGGFCFSWNFGDGSSHSTADKAYDTHTYTNPRNYTVVFTAIICGGGLAAQASHWVNVKPTPVAIDFSFPTAYSGSPVAINATAVGGTSPYSFTWNNGAGASASGNPVTVVYPTAGTYVIVLTVSDQSGNIASASHSSTVIDGAGLNPDFSFPLVTVHNPVTFHGGARRGGFCFNWDFGDGLHDNSADRPFDTHTYSTVGNYTVVFAAIYCNGGITGVAAQASHWVNVKTSSLTLDFTYPPVSSGSPIAVTAAVSGGQPPYGFAWDSGGAGTSNGNPVTFTYSVPGTYFIVVTATDAFGDTAITSHSLTVTDGTGLNMDFSFPAATQDSPVTFRGGIARGGFCISWTFGDGASDMSGYNVFDTHTYSTAGNYTVLVTASYCNSGITGVAAQASHWITVKSTPITLDFTFPPASSGSPVTFIATISGGLAPYNFMWDSGGAGTANGNHPTFTYATPGTYIIVLTSTDASGHTATASHSLTVIDGTGLNLDFFFISPVMQGHLANFTTGIARGGFCFTWNFGDGVIDTLLSKGFDNHTYTTPGIYTVFLSSNYCNGGASAYASHWIEILSPDPPPLVSFTASPNNVPTGTPITLTITATDPDGAISSLKVFWGDGTIDTLVGTATSDSHSYISVGNSMTKIFQVYVNATDDSGQTTQSPQSSVTINDRPPSAIFTASPTAPTTGTSISFDGSGSADPDGTVTSFAWNFGDGSTALGTVTTHAYASPGSYPVVLIVTDNSGNTGTAAISIVITSPQPSPTSTTIICMPANVQTGSPTTCTATVTDASSNPTTPTGTVTFTSDSNGAFSSPHCTLAPGTTGHATCSVTYTPNSGPGTGNHAITASYEGDASHIASSGTTSIISTRARVKCGGDDTCTVQSDSTITNADADGNRIRLTATGAKGTTGWANVTVPKRAVPNINRLRVTVDGNRLSRSSITITMNSTDYFVYFTFTFHSPVVISLEYNPAPDTILGFDPTTFYGSIAGVAAATVAAAIYLIGRSKTKSKEDIRSTRNYSHMHGVRMVSLMNHGNDE